MTPDQLKARFEAVRSLPTELTLTEATERFLNPHPLPPPPKPWYLNPYVIMLTLAFLLTALLSLPSSQPQLSLSAFPINVPAAENTATSTPFLPASEPVKFQLPEQPTLQPTQLSSPVGKPTVSVISPDQPQPITLTPVELQLPKIPPTTKPEKKVTPPGFYPQTLSGEWEYRKQRFHISLSSENSLWNLGYQLPITDEERNALKNTDKRPVKIVRAAGTLVILEGRKNGRFDFFPNETFHRELNELGWGDKAFSPDELPGNIVIPRSVIWFKYFLAGIDDDYLQELKDFGYTQEELTDLWHLANAQITSARLGDLLQAFRRSFTDRPPLKDYYGLRLITVEMPLLSEQQENRIPYTEYSGRLLFNPTVSPPALPALDSGLLFEPGPIPFPDLALKLPDNWGLSTSGRTVDTITYSPTYDLKLVVKGNIRLYLDRDLPAGQMIIYYSKGEALGLTRKPRRWILKRDCNAPQIDVAVNPTHLREAQSGRCAVMYMGYIKRHN